MAPRSSTWGTAPGGTRRPGAGATGAAGRTAGSRRLRSWRRGSRLRTASARFGAFQSPGWCWPAAISATTRLATALAISPRSASAATCCTTAPSTAGRGGASPRAASHRRPVRRRRRGAEVGRVARPSAVAGIEALAHRSRTSKDHRSGHVAAPAGRGLTRVQVLATTADTPAPFRDRTRFPDLILTPSVPPALEAEDAAAQVDSAVLVAPGERARRPHPSALVMGFLGRRPPAYFRAYVP